MTEYANTWSIVAVAVQTVGPTSESPAVTKILAVRSSRPPSSELEVRFQPTQSHEKSSTFCPGSGCPYAVSDDRACLLPISPP